MISDFGISSKGVPLGDFGIKKLQLVIINPKSQIRNSFKVIISEPVLSHRPLQVHLLLIGWHD